MTTKYLDPNRKVGSQAEISTLTKGEDSYKYGGYQEFTLFKDKLVGKGSFVSKFNSIMPYLRELKKSDPNVSLMDIGCSSGAIGFLSHFFKINNVVNVDHDSEYIKHLNEGIEFIESQDTIKAICSDVANVTEQADVVCVFALIHWLYSCTGDFGSLNSLTKFLQGLTKKTLFVEWIELDDGAIKYFNHLGYNKDIQTDPYNKEEFITNLHKHFPIVKCVASVISSRIIYMASNVYLDKTFEIPQTYTRIRSHCSTVYVDPTKSFVIKYFNGEFFNEGIFEREVYWLETMKDWDRIPRLVSHDKSRRLIIMTYVGDCITPETKPADYNQQIQDILNTLKKYECVPLDIKLDREILVRDGKLLICDFGWCKHKKLEWKFGDCPQPKNSTLKLLTKVLTLNTIMENYDICGNPENYVTKFRIMHWPVEFSMSVFNDVMNAFKYVLEQKGYEADIGNKFANDRINIIFGANNNGWPKLSPPVGSIIVQLEQLHDASQWCHADYMSLLRNYEVWDYSKENIEWLYKKTIIDNVKEINIGYAPTLEFPKENIKKKYDIVFFGSQNERRLKLKKELEKHPDIRSMFFEFNYWSNDRDKIIAQGKVLLNIHFYEAHILETVRISHLLANKCCVVSEYGANPEINEEWSKGVVFAEYDNIVETAVKYVKDSKLREAQAEKGYKFIMANPQYIPII